MKTTGCKGEFKYNLEREDSVIPLIITFTITPYTPARLHLPNGDPGYPAEGGDLEFTARDKSGKDIFNLLTREEILDIEERCDKEHCKADKLAEEMVIS